MENDNDTQDTNESAPQPERRLGYWLRTLDRLVAARIERVFAEEQVGRREWLLLNALSGEREIPGLAERLAQRGKKLRGLADRGWVAETEGAWTLTDEGRAARARIAAKLRDVREGVTSAVSPDDLATTLASLEAIARGLGWNEDADDRRFEGRFERGGFGFGPARGFGPGFAFGPGRGFGPGFGPRRGFEPRDGSGRDGGFGPDDRECGHPHHGHGFGPHGHRFGRGAGRGRDEGFDPREQAGERAYERGFEAGFRAAQRPAAS